MASISIGLILLSAIFHSLWNILTQTSKNSQIFSGLKGIWLILFAFFVFFIFGMPPKEMWLWGIVSGSLHGVYYFCLSRAYTTMDISYVYPIARSAPALVPGFAFFFLGERLEVANILGIGGILIAIYWLHFEGHVIRGFRNLWNAVFHENLRWAFLTLFMVVFYSLWDKWSMELFFEIRPDSKFQNGIGFFLMEASICFSLYNIYLIRSFPSRQIVECLKLEGKRGLLGALATVGSYGLICIVLQIEAVSKIVALRQTSVLIVVYWGCWKLGEPFGRQRTISAVLIVLGVILLGLE